MLKILDYGVGNVAAFKNVFHRLGIVCESATTAEDVLSADKLILPGVGAFDHAMSMFNSSGLRDAVETMVMDKQTPIIGICVGMQMLGNSSEEGTLSGLGWIPGIVKKFNFSDGNGIQVPHMGWNTIEQAREYSLFAGLGNSPSFYFLHSYYFSPSEHSHSAATCEYGSDITIAIARDNVYGVQFHPEKSHSNGHQLLRNFATL